MHAHAKTETGLRLQTGVFELELAPGIGGSVTALRAEGRNLLRPASAAGRAAGDPLAMAAFPLFPFCGRITDGGFDFRGMHVQLPGNFPPETNAIHGQSWQSPWRVEAAEVASALLVYDHAADAWPWPYRATQHSRLHRN